MTEFRRHTGVVAPFIVDNVDTDQIIPSREMKTVGKDGLGVGLFAGQRYVRTDDGTRVEDPAFVLNKNDYRNATILLAGDNFGCGSSREHAVWALADFGIRAIIARGFGKIFRANCARNRVLAIALSAEKVAAIAAATAEDPPANTITIDLEAEQIRLPGGDVIAFQVAPFDRKMLLDGLDYIDYTLRYRAKITEFLERDRASRPWAHR